MVRLSSEHGHHEAVIEVQTLPSTLYVKDKPEPNSLWMLIGKNMRFLIWILH